MSVSICEFPLGKYIFNIFYIFFLVMSIAFWIFLTIFNYLPTKSGVKFKKSAEVIMNLMPSRSNDAGMS